MDLDTIPREIIILLQVTFSLSSLSCVCKCVCVSVCLCTCICWDRKHVKCKLCRTDCLQSKCTEKHILSTKNYIFLYSHMCVYIYIYIYMMYKQFFEALLWTKSCLPQIHVLKPHPPVCWYLEVGL